MYDILAFTQSHSWGLFVKACSTFHRPEVLDLRLDALKVNSLRCMQPSIQNFIAKKGTLRLATLLYLPDKAGKTRVVYCLTWWFQEL